MTTILLALNSVISLFFSLIFATTISRNKSWYQLYVPLSLFILFIHSINTLLGHLFTWYSWNVYLFLISYALIMPSLVGLLFGKALFLYHPLYKQRWSLLYLMMISIPSIFLYLHISAHIEQIALEAPISLLAWFSQAQVYPIITVYPTVVLIVISLLIWIRSQEEGWLLLSLSALFFSVSDRTLQHIQPPLWAYSIMFLIIILFIIWAGVRFFRIKS